MAVSVVIPAFNRRELLLRAVGSVLAQSRNDFELVVVDDASTEELSRVRELVETAGHRWIRFDENRGPAAARNVGVAASVGQWVAFLDSDDRWLPEKLERQLAWHEAHPEIAISQCEEFWIRHGRRVNKPAHLRQPETGCVFDRCVERCCISPSSVMVSRQLWDRHGGFDERYRVCEDYELWLRIALENEVGFVPGNLVEKNGGHADQISRNFPVMDRLRVLALLELLAENLPEAERAISLRELGRKATILQTGAEKRGLPERALYEAIANWSASDPSVAVPPDLPAALRLLCFPGGKDNR